MNSLPLTPEVAEVSKRVIWFEDSPQAVSGPIRFVAYAMTHATCEDMEVIRQYLSDEDLRKSLRRLCRESLMAAHGPVGI